MISLQTNSSGDIAIDLTLAYGIDAVVQHVRQRLSFYTGESQFDTSIGTNWVDGVFGVNTGLNIPMAERILTDRVLNTNGVVGFGESPIFEWDLNNRTMNYKFCVTVDCENSLQSAYISGGLNG